MIATWDAAMAAAGAATGTVARAAALVGPLATGRSSRNSGGDGMTSRVRVADLFCGAGGSSTGAVRAVEALGYSAELVCVDQWSVAIATHSRNHPDARHHCIDLDAARPEQLVPEGALDLLMASPECIFFSNARGGKPVNDHSRMGAWHVQRWASALDIRCILVENVPEFMTWGPLRPDDRPDRTRRGEYFRAWVEALRAMGYAVDWRLLNSADYGDATTRTRLFVQARKDGVPIRWRCRDRPCRMCGEPTGSALRRVCVFCPEDGR